MPSANPTVDEPEVKKTRKNVGSIAFTIIRNGIPTPNRSNIKPKNI